MEYRSTENSHTRDRTRSVRNYDCPIANGARNRKINYGKWMKTEEHKESTFETAERRCEDNSSSRFITSEQPIAGPWLASESGSTHLKPINLAPLKNVLESDPMRSRVLRVLIEDGDWVTTGDLLKTAKQVRPIVGAVTIGTILSGLNELVSARLILSRTSLSSGIEWAEWRINPDWIGPTRKLLQMLIRHRLRDAQSESKQTVRREQNLLENE